MDTDWFQEALRKIGCTQADLSRQLDLPPSAVSRMLRGERQMKIQEAIVVAEFLGVTQEEVLRHVSSPSSSGSSEPARRGRPPLRDTALRDHRPIGDLIPIRRADEAPVGFTRHPGNLAGVRDAYAVYVEDLSLSPRYEPGWLLHVHPFKPASPGRDVVVRTKDDTVLIRQFVSWDGDALVLRQLNPGETLRVQREGVIACHLVVGVDQEG
jgi:transcriptional regulator with XRE-family HTH domain